MEQAIKDLEKTLDLDSFGQVSFKLPQQIGVGTSFAGTSQQPVQENSTPVTRSSKGKEVASMEQQAITDQQGKIPPVQTKAAKIYALHTPLNEDKGKKREREEAMPISGPTEQSGEKRQRNSPLLEEEIFEEITESLRGERQPTSRHPQWWKHQLANTGRSQKGSIEWKFHLAGHQVSKHLT